MKTIAKEKILQKLISIILIIAMLSSYFPIFVLAEETEDTENLNDYIVLDVNWKGSEGSLAAETKTTYMFDYNLEFNNMPTGFRNVIMKITNKNDGTPTATISSSNNTNASFVQNSNGYSYIEFGNKNTGIEIGGDTNVIFGDNGTKYNKEILITVTAEYTDPKTNEVMPLKVEKTLTAEVTPKKEVTSFLSTIRMQRKNGIDANETVVGNRIDMGMSEYNRTLGWYSTKVTATYPIHIDSYTYTQKLDLDITINRIYANESKLNDGYTVNWGGLDTELGTPTQTTNEDGSIKYHFSKGTDSAELVKENTFSVNKDFTVVIQYDIPNTNPEQGGSLVELNSTCTFKAEMESIGFKTEKEYNEEEKVEKITEKSAINKSNYVGLYQYTPGNHAWIGVTFSTIGNSYLDTQDMQNFIDNRTIDLSFASNINNSCNWGDKDSQTGQIYFRTPTITYLSDSGEIVSKTLNGNQMRLKSITESASASSISNFIYYSITGEDNVRQEDSIEFDANYNVASDLNINTFKIEMEEFLYNNFYNYYTTYTINADELGLSDTEIANILTITVDTTTTGGGRWLQGGGNASFYNTNSIGNKYSYMEFDIGDFNTEVSKLNIPETKQITLKMLKNDKVMKTEQLATVNENPIFYVNLPSQFKYKNINVDITENNYGISINENEIDMIKMNGETYLVIPCSGTYDSSKMGEIDITVSFKRTLTSASIAGDHNIYAYMITDNERYWAESDNNLGFSKGDVVPSKMFSASKTFNIGGDKIIQAETRIKRDDEGEYKPNPADDIIETGEKERPATFESNDKVTYVSKITSSGDTLKNITIISRLPIANNKFFDGTAIIGETETLDDDYYNDFKNNINGMTNEEPIKQLSLQNLQNIAVYKNTNTNNKVSESDYTIYYSTEETVDFTSTSFIEYEPGVSDLSQAKNIKVVFNENYTLTSGNNLSIQYEMTMPDQAGMVGATTAVQYTKADEEEPTTLYSPAAYVINGYTKGTINVTKVFEGLNQGVAPTELSTLAGIEFKLQYYDETTASRKFLQDAQGNDIVATTNESGVATFSDIPYGEYFLYEVTTFQNYENDSKIEILDLEPAATLNYTRLNRKKRGDIIINKAWEDTNEQQGAVTFKITKNTRSPNADNIQFTPRTITKNKDESQVVIPRVPYGDYIIQETSTVAGWKADSSKAVSLNAETATADFTNKIGTGNIQLVKTVPQGETVNGLKFHITSMGMISYVNKDGETVTHNTDLTVTVGEDYSSNNNINVVVSDNNTKATITLSNLYLGLYTIEEIEIPVINGTEIEKYVAASKTVNLSTAGQSLSVNIENKYKTGYLQINKTAKLKDGDTYTDIGDLSSFKIRVTGTSYYGNAVDETIELDEDGYGIAKLEIGKYTVTEVAKEGYTAYYGKDATASTTPPEITINESKTTTQNIYNEHTGKGYVRVEKTLEGKDDPQKVLDAGIQFKVVGQNVAGGRVEETIKIDKIDKNKNVAYGVSGPISSGGEYVLQEVESTVPNFYEGIEPIEPLVIKSSNTAQSPLVINAVNKRTKGNLEIITETNPVGGPLTGITYKVTEVEINKNGTYVKVGETLDIAGSNDTIDPSFAELEEINAGYYLVEQVTVPDGWQKDVSQIVEVPSYNTGYATFEITEIKKLNPNTVTINKIVLNENNEVVTDEELEKVQLNKNESFEVKITNIDTNKEYYVFTSVDEPGVIQGLDAGNYTIEEVYKPKYTTEGYYNNVKIEPNHINSVAEIISPTYVEDKIVQTDGKYIFTITENDNGIENVSITIKNKINTNFGFGGQDLADNFSKIKYDKVETITRAIVYVVDENNNAISGAKFKLVNEKGQIAQFNGETEFEVNNRKMTLRGLDVGKYTLICTQYPVGYLKPEDKEVIVYSDVVQVARVEIQKNIPRGTITLSTVYTTDDGETKYVSRSKYKVVDKETGELVKFVRTATGDYKKSNLPDASPVIVLKSGVVEVEGIEVGKYEVGIVDVTKGYGIQSELPEDVVVEENAVQNVCVEVLDKEIVQVQAGYNSTMYLNESGELFYVGYSYYGVLANGKEQDSTSQFKKIEFADGVKIEKFSYNNGSVVALDTERRAWVWGYNGRGQLGLGTTGNVLTPTCVSETLRFTDVMMSGTNTMLLLDTDGKVWASGECVGVGVSNMIPTLACISNASQEIGMSYNSGVKTTKLATSIGGVYHSGLIDSLGRVWTWGRLNLVGNGSNSTNNLYVPTCISEVSDLGKVKVKDVVLTDNFSMALDENGDIWLWGDTILQGQKYVPTKVDSSVFGNVKIKSIAGAASTAIVVDEYGKVWTWGNGRNGQLGNGTTETLTQPTCISDEEAEKLYGIEIVSVSAESSSGHIVALDNNNIIWAWGGNNTYGESGINNIGSAITIPQPMTVSYNEHLDYNVKFKEVFNSFNYSFAIDEEGKLWVWGSRESYVLGLKLYNDILTPTILEIPGNPKIKKVYSDNSSTIILSEDGRVFVCGYSYLGNGTNVTYTTLTEITDNFNLDEDVIIVDIFTYENTYITLDSDGKIYTWGDSKYIGRTTDAKTIECISDDDSEVLNGVKIVKIGASYNNGIIAIDENGNIYEWERYKVPSKIKVLGNEKIVDVKYGILLDENGNLWSKGYNSECYSCINNEPSNALYKNYQLDSEYKIVEIYSTYGKEPVILRDSNGDLWKCESKGTSVSKFEGMANINGNTVLAGAMPKEIISLSGHLLVDKYGQIWVYINIDNEYGAAGNGTTSAITHPICLSNPLDVDASNIVFKANNTLVNSPVDNNLYGIKIKELINDHFVIDENDNIWYFTNKGNATNLTSTYQGDLNSLYGKQIKRIINNNYIVTTDNKIWYIGGDYPGYVMDDMSVECEYLYEYYGTAGREYYIALDSNGKLWTCGVDASGSGILGNGVYSTNCKPVCISNIEGTELYNAYVNDSNFRIEKLLSAGSRIIVLDNSGKIWAWGTEIGNGTKDKVLTPVCISNIENTDLYNAHTADANMKIVKVDDGYYIDSYEEMWIIDEVTNTFKRFRDVEADGDLRQAYLDNNNFKVVKTDCNYFAIGNDGTVYVKDFYLSEYEKIDNLTGITDIYEMYDTVSVSGNYRSHNERYIAYGKNGVYEISIKYRAHEVPPTYSYDQHSVTATKLSTCNITKVAKIGDSNYAIDDNGNLWKWGYINKSYYQFNSVTNDTTHVLYQKQLKDIQVIGTDFIVIDIDDNMYAWGESSSTPILCTQYDDIILKLFGEVNNENRIKYLQMKATCGIHKIGNTFYNINTGEVYDYTKEQYINGIGKIEGVVGEWEIQTQDGTIYQVRPTSALQFVVEKVEQATDFVNVEVDPIEIEGANIVKQTKYKALDDKGNLYVWDDYTGLSYGASFDGVLCLTNEQYYIKPIYSNSNGWSIIRNQF